MLKEKSSYVGLLIFSLLLICGVLVNSQIALACSCESWGNEFAVQLVFPDFSKSGYNEYGHSGYSDYFSILYLFMLWQVAGKSLLIRKKIVRPSTLRYSSLVITGLLIPFVAGFVSFLLQTIFNPHCFCGTPVFEYSYNYYDLGKVVIMLCAFDIIAPNIFSKLMINAHFFIRMIVFSMFLSVIIAVFLNPFVITTIIIGEVVLTGTAIMVYKMFGLAKGFKCIFGLYLGGVLILLTPLFFTGVDRSSGLGRLFSLETIVFIYFLTPLVALIIPVVFGLISRHIFPSIENIKKDD